MSSSEAGAGKFEILSCRVRSLSDIASRAGDASPIDEAIQNSKPWGLIAPYSINKLDAGIGILSGD